MCVDVKVKSNTDFIQCSASLYINLGLLKTVVCVNVWARVELIYLLGLGLHLNKGFFGVVKSCFDNFEKSLKRQKMYN